MIKVSELRIGNYYADKHGNIEKVTQLMGYPLERIDDLPNDWALPVPITEEWLVKFGFIGFADDRIEYKKGNLRLSWSELSGCYTFCEGIVFVEIHHLHQLQNLHIALTGQELTV